MGSQTVFLIISLTRPRISLKLTSVGRSVLFIVFWSLLVLNQSSSWPRWFILTLMPLTYCNATSSCAIIAMFSGVKGLSMFQHAIAVVSGSPKNMTPRRDVAWTPAWLERLNLDWKISGGLNSLSFSESTLVNFW